MATFETLDIALQLVASLRTPLERLRQHDADLASQVRRAASSVALNIGEGHQRAGKDRLHLFRIAAGSAAEVRTALQVALAWGYLDLAVIAPSLAVLDRVLAMLWRLTHPRRA